MRDGLVLRWAVVLQITNRRRAARLQRHRPVQAVPLPFQGTVLTMEAEDHTAF